MNAGMNPLSPSFLPSPDLGNMKAERKGETEGALDILGDGPRPSLTCMKRSDPALIAQSIDCVPTDFPEGQPAKEVSFVAQSHKEG